MRDQTSPGAILVVGGAGYIGSHTVKLLRKKGFSPIVFDDLSTGHAQATLGCTLVRGNIGDIRLVENTIKSHGVKTVIHFGAKSIVADSVADPLEYYRANVGETTSLLTAMRNTGVRHLVFSSTCATFGEPHEVPIHERVEQRPVNPYGASKLFVERILKDVESSFGLHSAVLRYFNAAGADPDGAIGEDHRPETHLMPRVIRAALAPEKQTEKLQVYGTDYPTPDGSCVRDYIHVNDLADAHIRAMEWIWKNSASNDFNLGTEHGHSVFEVIRSVEKATGKSVPVEIAPRRPGDPPTLIADASKARRELGWTAQFGLDAIVQTATAWLRAHPRGFEE